MAVVQIKLEVGGVGFCGGWITGELGGKNPRGKAKTNNKLNTHDVTSTGIEHGSQR